MCDVISVVAELMVDVGNEAQHTCDPIACISEVPFLTVLTIDSAATTTLQATMAAASGLVMKPDITYSPTSTTVEDAGPGASRPSAKVDSDRIDFENRKEARRQNFGKARVGKENVWCSVSGFRQTVFYTQR
jgi:hypothetical protein